MGQESATCIQEVAQLSQRDCDAGWVRFGKNGRLERGYNILQTL